MDQDGPKPFLAPRLAALTLVLALATALTLVGRWHWLADLASHFVPHYTAAGVLLFIGLVWSRSYRWAVLALLLAAGNGYRLSPYLWPDRTVAINEATRIELLQFNVSLDNPEPGTVIDYIRSLETPPHAIVLLEITSTWSAYLTTLRDLFPTIALMPRSDNFGMAVLSRLPESDIDFRESGTPSVPLMVLTARVADKDLLIYATHPPPPLGGLLSAARNAQLKALASEIAPQTPQHVIVAGDLNTTVWSQALAPLIHDAGLRDAQRGRGYLPTWAPPPLWRWLGIPIDHTLVSDNVTVVGRLAGPRLGSDHWPVLTILSLR